MGRHETPKLPLEERKCDKCNSDEIEDVLHSLLICIKNITPRTTLFFKAADIIANFHSLNNNKKIPDINVS